jgi:predicted ATPase/DNA-binding SARP family transcriptional activator/DNA-binding XRE family transcriptional regulator
MTRAEQATDHTQLAATARLRLALLGRADLSLDGQPLTPVGGPRLLALLAVLAVERDQPQRRERLAQLLWPEQPDATARDNLRVALHRLRRALPSSFLTVSRETVQLTAEDDIWLDVAEFQALLATCRQHAHPRLHTCAECIVRLDQAVALYRGEFLFAPLLADNPAFEEWLLVRREELAGQLREALAALAASHEQVGNYVALCQIARRQLQLDPWNEPAHRQLMQGLALAGDRTAALAQYETCRRILAQELGTEPEAETRALAEGIRAGEAAQWHLSGRAQAAHLPTHLTPFIGREGELAALTADLQRPGRRLITLIGNGGMGKTRLAVEAARMCLHAYPDGVFFVSLAALRSAAAIAPTIAAAIGQDLHSDDPSRAVVRFLSNKELLLILDNFEHLLEPEPALNERGGAALVLDLLQCAPGVQLLVTSRERLNVRGEQLVPVPGLDYAVEQAGSPAAQLFVQAAQRVQPAFELDAAGLDHVQHICQLLKGMPLGLELAAAWTETLPLHEIASEIEHSLDFLAADWRDAPERQRSLRAVFDWSWQLLDEGERQTLRRLSIFRGGFSRWAAEVVVGASLHMLASLMRKSLVGWGQDVDDSGRYDLHELLRQFAAEQMEPTERTELEARHGAFYLGLVADREWQLLGVEAHEAVSELRCDLDNIRQAWSWAAAQAEIDQLAASASAVRRLYYALGLLAEGERAFAVAAERMHSALSRQAATGAGFVRHVLVTSQLDALHAALLAYQGKFQQALPLALAAVTLAEPRDGVEGMLAGFLVSGEVLYRQGRYQAAREHLERALLLAGTRMQKSGTGPDGLFLDAKWRACIWLGLGALAQDDYPAASNWIGESLRSCTGPGLLFVPSVLARARLSRRRGEYAAARADSEEALRAACLQGHAWSQGASLLRQGEIARLQGAHAEAVGLTERALALAREIGDRQYEADALVSMAHLSAVVGDTEAARSWLEQAGELLAAIGTREVELDALLLAARLSGSLGESGAALTQVERAWRIAVETGSRWWQADVLTVKGQALAGLGQSSAAAAAYRQALELAADIGLPLLTAEPHAGLAALALAEGEAHLALTHVDRIVRLMAEQPRVGMADPSSVYLTCYQVLKASRDPRAGTILEAGQLILADDAAHLSDERWRRSFAEVPAHRALRTAGALPGLDEPFGGLLRRLRAAAGLTQEALAERAGLSLRGISDLERGARRVPHTDTLRRLGLALELDPEAQRGLAAAAKQRSAV